VDAAIDELFRLSLRRDGLLEHPESATVEAPPQRLENAKPVLGQLQAGSTDRYRIPATAGDNLTIELTSIWQPNGAPLADWTPVVRILDSADQELVREVADPVTQSVTLALPILEDDHYTVEVRSESPAGSEYLLTVNGATRFAAPEVLSISPADQSSAVFPKTLFVTFDTPIDLTSVRAEQVSVGGVPSLGFGAVSARTIRFQVDIEAITPVPGTVYPIVISGGAVRDLAGRESAEFQSSFTAQSNPADVDGNGRVDAEDLDAFCQAVLEGGDDLTRLDLNGDDIVDHLDLNTLARDELGSRLGDVNLDGTFNAMDLVQLFQHGLYETDFDADWSQGDADCDGRFTSGDLVAMFQSGGYEDPPLVAEAAIVNGSFETGDFSGWEIEVAGESNEPWEVTSELAGVYVWDGSFAAWNGFDGNGPTSFRMWQDVVIPGDVSLATIRWLDLVEWSMNPDSQPREYRVQLQDPASGAVLTTLYEFSTDASSRAPEWQAHLVNVSDYIGSEVRLMFEEYIPESFTGPARIAFDAIRIGVRT
jgi:hypothetical protein